ncbi:NOB1 [Bugula neritina]|uniref:NOB1 n=1 Tax=Bugula neritina TaxID=10212 RepID=A0A7J7IXL0_BUGNE|nr:NOB1 [Bugula neritina]
MPSIPLPKGGKYSNYPKLTEDQKLPQRKQARQKKQHYGVFDPDYIANSSPFALRDTTSRSAMLGAGRNFNKRDPNAGPRRRKK